MGKNDFIKITEDMYEKSEMDIRDILVDRVQTIEFGSTVDFEDQLIVSMINCESPIEQLLAMEMAIVGVETIYLFNPFVDVLGIENQKEIIANGKKYRVDFLIGVVYYKGKPKSKRRSYEYCNFVVECDGHEFHQKTKEQVEKDNIRTRDLQAAGYEVIRFSGSEIWKKPKRCALDILSLILSKCKY